MSALVGGSILLLFAIGVPVAFAMMLASFIYFVVIQTYPIAIWVQRVIGGIDSFPLLAIPFFILAGGVMTQAGMMDRLIRFAASLVGAWTGGLAQVNVVVSTMFGGMSGSAIADVVAEAKALVPAMNKRGYPPAFTAAVTAASSVITSLIPPSIGMIIYGFITETSIGRLFLAGIVPGLITTVTMMLLVWWITTRRRIDPAQGQGVDLKEVWASFREAFWALLMPVWIVVGLRFGIFTPTEAGAVAAVYALVVGMFIYRTIKISDLGPLLVTGAAETAMVMLIIASAEPFGWVLTVEQVPQQATQALVGIAGNNPVLTLLLINVFLLVVGTLVDPAPLMLIVVPMLMPTIRQLGISDVQFGVIVNVNLLIGALTPPEGVLLFATMAMAKVKMGELSREMIPFFILLIALLLLFTYVPAVSLWLPDLVMGPVK